MLPYIIKKIFLSPSAREAKPDVQQDKVCCYGVPLATTTLAKTDLIIYSYYFVHFAALKNQHTHKNQTSD